MAKKKSKKSSSNLTGLIIKIVVIALAVLTICTLFMPVISRKTAALGGDFETTYSIKGADVFTGLFKGEMSKDYTEGANALINLKDAEGAGFVTNFFMILYLVLVVVSIAVLVFNVLSILGMKFKLVNIILALATVVLAVLTFIFAIVVASKLGKLDLGVIVETKGVIAIGTYFLIATLLMGCAHAYDTKMSK